MFDPGLTVDPPFRDALHAFLEHGGFFFPGRMNDGLIMPDSVDCGSMRLLFHRCVGVVVTLFDRRVVLDHPVIDDGRRPVVVDDGGAVYVGHPNIPVAVSAGEITLIDDDGAVYICITADVDVDPGDGEVGHDHRVRSSPWTAGVVGLARRQRNPSDVGPAVNP